MVARGLVREAREDLEVHQAKLKEVRDRLDRISREDNQYLELATLEHRLLQVGTQKAALPHWIGTLVWQVTEGPGGDSDWSVGQRSGEKVNQKLWAPRFPEPVHPLSSRVLGSAVQGSIIWAPDPRLLRGEHQGGGDWPRECQVLPSDGHVL